jgi:hypothetical protein
MLLEVNNDEVAIATNQLINLLNLLDTLAPLLVTACISCCYIGDSYDSVMTTMCSMQKIAMILFF